MSVFYRDIDVKISNYKSELSEPLVVFERDRGLEIYFNLIKYAYRLDKHPKNLLENLVGAYATVTLVNPDGYEISIDEVEITEDAKVKFIITEDLTDELTEIGIYQLQIHVNNDVKGKDTSVFSVPYFSFEVRERLKGKKSELFDSEGNRLTDKEGYQLVSATSNKIINFPANKINEYLNSIPTIQNEMKNLDSQLDSKANLNSIFSMANMGQDVKEAMTGGSVAVVGKNTVSNDNIVNKAISFNKTNFIEVGKNLLNPDNLLYGFYMEGNGTLKAHDNYVVTDYIPFSDGQCISLNRNVNGGDNSFREIRKATFYNSNFEPLPTLAYDNLSAVAEPLKCPSDSSVKYVRLSLGKGYVDRKSILHYGNSLEDIEDFCYIIKNLKIPVKFNNPLYGKKIIGFGDSIMRGAGNNDVGIVDILGERNNMEVTNLAVSGATIMKTQTNNIPTQIENCNIKADYVILDGYINDCNSTNVINNLGEVSPYFGSTFSTNTFCGQLETMLRDMHKKFLGAKFLYIFVHKMGTRDDAIVKPVHAKAKEICNKWSIPIVDLYEESIMNTYIDKYKIYTGNEDKTHPNNLGYTKYYIPLIEAKLKSL